MTDQRVPLFDEEDSNAEKIEMAAARITNDAASILHEAMSLSGMAQRDIAIKLGVGESRVSQVLSGEGNIRLSTLGRYLGAMGFDLELKLNRIENRRKRRHRRSATKQRFAIWEHLVISKTGCQPAYVVAFNVDAPKDVLHQTFDVIAEGDARLSSLKDAPESYRLIEAASFGAPWKTEIVGLPSSGNKLIEDRVTYA